MSEAQKKDGWCGPAALSFALSQIGIDVSQETIVKDTGTTTNGVDPFPLEKTAKKYGAQVEILNGGLADDTIEKMDTAKKEGAAVIVDYLVGGEEEGGHYVVFMGKNGNNIRIWNPSGGKRMSLEKPYFTENWRDWTEGGKTMKNWAMILRA